MRISGLFPEIVGLLAVFVAVLGGLLSPEVQAQDVTVRNVQVAQHGNTIVVTYSLTGTGEGRYEVDLRVSDDNGESFQIEPSALSGAVGNGVEPGKQKEIVWEVLEDFPQGLEGEGYKFRVIGRRIAPSALGFGAVASSGIGRQTGSVCCGVGARFLWTPRAYPVELSLNAELWRRVRVNTLSLRLNYMYNEKALDVGLYNTFSFGDVDIYRAGFILSTKIGISIVEIGPSIRYPMYFSILGDEFSEFGFDNYFIIGSHITLRF